MFKLFLVAGPSGVGKKTFVDRIGDDEVLQLRFHIEKPIEAINSREGKPLLKALREVLPQIANSGFNGTVIVKWQARMRREDFSCDSIESVSGVWLTLPMDLLAAQFFSKHRENPNYGFTRLDDAKRVIVRDSQRDFGKFSRLGIAFVAVDSHSSEILSM